MANDTTNQIDPRMAVSELPQYLSVEEIQSYLRIGRSSAYKFADEHGVRFGRLVRVPREKLGPKEGR